MKQTMLKKISAFKKLFAPGTQKPIYLLNFVTNSCNAACDHCFYWEELNTNKRQELSVEEHSKIAKSLVPCSKLRHGDRIKKDVPEISLILQILQTRNMSFLHAGIYTNELFHMFQQC